ncbi:transcription regulatory protein SNF5, putative (BSH) isoform X2 [Carex rostrata]
MKSFAGSTSKAASIKFCMPTRESLIPIRLDLDVDGHRYKDAFTWNPDDSEVLTFAKRTVKDLKLPPTFVTQISQSIQSQLAEFRSYGGQDMYIREKIVPLKVDLRVNNTVIRDHFLWDISNFESDPEEFARTLCNDLDVADPEVAPAIAVSIREQLFEIAAQSVSAVREAKLGKKGRRTYDLSKGGNNALDVSKYFGSKGSGVIRYYFLFYCCISIILASIVEFTWSCLFTIIISEKGRTGTLMGQLWIFCQMRKLGLLKSLIHG